MTSRITGNSTVYSACSDKPLPYLWGESTSGLCYDVTLHRQIHCLFGLFRQTTALLVRGIHQWLITWEALSCYNIIMSDANTKEALIQHQFIVASWHHMAKYNGVHIGSGNGLLPYATKPLHEPLLNDHQWGLVPLIWGQFHRKCSRYLYLMWVWNQVITWTDVDQKMLTVSLLMWVWKLRMCGYSCIFQRPIS